MKIRGRNDDEKKSWNIREFEMRFKAFLKDSTNLHKIIKLTDFILHKKTRKKMESMKSEQNRNNEMANTTTIILNLTL